MKKIILVLILMFTVISTQKSYAVDCPDGYFSKTIELYDASDNFVCWYFVCYKCEDTNPGDFIFKGFIPSAGTTLNANQIYALCLAEIENLAPSIMKLCDIPPCSTNTKMHYTISIPVCLQWQHDGTEWLVGTCLDGSMCIKEYEVCFDDPNYITTVTNAYLSGTPTCTSTVPQPKPLTLEDPRPCWASPDAWCYTP